MYAEQLIYDGCPQISKPHCHLKPISRAVTFKILQYTCQMPILTHFDKGNWRRHAERTQKLRSLACVFAIAGDAPDLHCSRGLCGCSNLRRRDEKQEEVCKKGDIQKVPVPYIQHTQWHIKTYLWSLGSCSQADRQPVLSVGVLVGDFLAGLIRFSTMAYYWSQMMAAWSLALQQLPRHEAQHQAHNNSQFEHSNVPFRQFDMCLSKCVWWIYKWYR